MTKYTKEQIDNAQNMLNKFLKEDMQVYTTVHSVAASGMSRKMSLYIVHDDGIMNITFWVAAVLGLKMDSDHKLTISGCGMDMGWKIVNDLSYRIFNSGKALNQRWL